MGITDNRSNTYAGSNDQNLDKVLICHVNVVMSTLSRTDRSVGNSVVEVEVLKKLAMTGKWKCFKGHGFVNLSGPRKCAACVFEEMKLIPETLVSTSIWIKQHS